MTRLAIQPDKQLLTSGRMQSFSEQWNELAATLGFEARRVDVYAPDFLDQLDGCHGFLWWFGQPPGVSEPGRRVVAALRQARPDLPVFPSWETIWHFDDKAAQAYLLKAAGIPTPRTWVFWRLERARAFVGSVDYPLVLKLPGGITSSNVALVHDAREGRRWVARLFGRGVYDLGAAGATPGGGPAAAWRRLRAAARRTILGPRPFQRVHRGCLLLQEFLPGNAFDTRVTVIGDRAFAFRRHNRSGDFRASGSGRIDWDQSAIAEDAVRLAFRTAQALRTQSLAVDVLRRDGEPVIGEVSYYYEGWAVAACPGHWTARGGGLAWVGGPMRPEDAILEDFLARVRGEATVAGPHAP